MKKKRVPLLKKGKHKKHDAIVNDFEAQKNKHFVKTLEENLPYYIREEQYEGCQRIVDAINELKNPIVKPW